MKCTVAEVKRSYREEKMVAEREMEPLTYHLYRVPSFYLTPLFLAASVPANVVTIGSLLVALFLPAVAFLGGKSAYLYVAFLAYVFVMLDTIDGNVARMTGTADCIIRAMPTADSEACRPPNAEYAVHLFQWHGVHLFWETGISGRHGLDSVDGILRNPWELL